MTEEILNDELSEIALETVTSTEKPIAAAILPVIAWLRAIVFVIIGAIVCK